MTNKIKFSALHTTEIPTQDLLAILKEYLDLPDNAALEFKTVSRYDSFDRDYGTEVVGVLISYRD